MGLILKIGSATALLGFAGCGSMCASGCVNTIKMQLEEEGFKLINSDSGWEKVLSKYKDSNLKKNINLKSSCKTLLKQNPNNNNYNLAVKWCVEEESLQTILSKKYKILDIEPNKENDKSEWENKVQKLKQSKNEKFKEWRNSINGGNPDISTLKNACKQLGLQWINSTNDKFVDIFTKAKTFCSIKKTN